MLDSQPNEFKVLLKRPNIKLVLIPPYCMQYPLSLFNEQVRFFSRHFFGEYTQKNYIGRLKQELKKREVTSIHHSETCYFEAPNFINVITINDLIPIKFPRLCQKKTIENMKKKLDFAKNHCEKIICLSENTKKDLLKYWGKNAGRKNIKVVYPSVPFISKASIPFSRINMMVEKAGYQKLSRKNFFLSYGTYEPRKNITMLADLFITMDKQNKLKKSTLVLVGGRGWGGVWGRIESQIQTQYPNKKESPIIQLGFVEDDILASLIKHAKAVLYPTIYEGFGLPVIESLSLGTPIYCSDNSSLPEICRGNCTLVAKNQWKKLMNDIIYCYDGLKYTKKK